MVHLLPISINALSRRHPRRITRTPPATLPVAESGMRVLRYQTPLPRHKTRPARSTSPALTATPSCSVPLRVTDVSQPAAAEG